MRHLQSSSLRDEQVRSSSLRDEQIKSASLRDGHALLRGNDPSDMAPNGPASFAIINTPNGEDAAFVRFLSANAAPVAVSDKVSTDEDSPLLSIAVLANDSDADAQNTLTITAIDSTDALGIVTDNGDGTLAYDPRGKIESLAAGETAIDSFTYTISDGQGGLASATVIVTIHGATDDPDSVVTGTIDSDTIQTGDGADTVFGDAGDDHIDGLGGADSLNGSTGHDTLYGSTGSDTLVGGDGADLLFGGGGDDLLIGDVETDGGAG